MPREFIAVHAHAELCFVTRYRENNRMGMRKHLLPYKINVIHVQEKKALVSFFEYFNCIMQYQRTQKTLRPLMTMIMPMLTMMMPIAFASALITFAP